MKDYNVASKAQIKIKKLMEAFGYETEEAMLEDAAFDSVVPGICMNCDYTTDVEPDCQSGFCEQCQTQTVQSVLIILGII
jgi:hypothetical protein